MDFICFPGGSKLKPNPSQSIWFQSSVDSIQLDAKGSVMGPRGPVTMLCRYWGWLSISQVYLRLCIVLLQFVSRFHRFTFSCDASLGYVSKKDFDRVHSKQLILDLISLTSHHFSTSFYHLLNNIVPRLQESKPMMLHCSQRPAKGLSRMPGSSAWMIDG